MFKKVLETSMNISLPIKRPRRNRKSEAIRSLIAETEVNAGDLIMPFFVLEGEKKQLPIPSMPGIHRLSGDYLLKEAELLHAHGIPGIILFPTLEKEQKDVEGSYALKTDSFFFQSIELLKKELPSLCIIADLALDPYTSHGHDGLVDTQGRILNDETSERLAEIAVLLGQAGADFIAPSDMMDGRVFAIRTLLDANKLYDVGIISYSAKYVSSLYTPFRDVLQSHVKFGDKKTYQLNPANVREALLEAKLDEEEGADMLMVKPALFYLDVISKMRAQTNLPIAAFHVSGEYAMVMAAHEKGVLDATKTFHEALLSIKRAGADFIFTYAAKFMIK